MIPGDDEDEDLDPLGDFEDPLADENMPDEDDEDEDEDDEDTDEDGRMPWEAASRAAVENALNNARWDLRGKKVTVNGIIFESIDALELILCTLADGAWNESVPCEDDGTQIWERNFDPLDILIEQCEGQLAQLGWT